MKQPFHPRHPRRRHLRALLYLRTDEPGMTTLELFGVDDPLRRVAATCEWWRHTRTGTHSVRFVDQYIERGPRDTSLDRPVLRRVLTNVEQDADIDLLVVPTRATIATQPEDVATVVSGLAGVGVRTIFVEEEAVPGDLAATLAA